MTSRLPGLAALLLILTGPGCRSEAPAPRSHTFGFPVMGTDAACTLELPPDLEPAAAEAMVRAAYAAVETALSAWRPDSELSTLNRAPADSAVTLSPLLSRCLAAGAELTAASGGAFDPAAGPLMDLWGFRRGEGRLPTAAETDSARTLVGRWRFAPAPPHLVKEDARAAFDLGGIAKGLAVDLATERLAAAGVRDGLLDLGGNLFCLGGAAGAEDWRVGIKDPLAPDRVFATVPVSGAAVATSGSYEKFVEIDGVRYGHIMNPATGRPAAGILAVTVIAPRAVLADGLSTTLFVLGPEAGLRLLAERYPQAEAVFVLPGTGPEDCRILVTPGLRGRLTILPAYAGRCRLED